MDSGESFWELKSDFGAIFFRNLGTPQKKVAKIWDFEKPRTLQPPVFSRGAVPNGEMIKAQFGAHFRQNRRFYITRFISNPIRGTW